MMRDRRGEGDHHNSGDGGDDVEIALETASRETGESFIM